MKWLAAFISAMMLIAPFSSPVRAGAIQAFYVVDGDNLRQISIREAASGSDQANNLKQISIDNHNNLKQIGIPTNDTNNLKQIAIGLHDATGTYFGDGSVRTIGGDGSSLYVSPDWGSSGAMCLRNVNLPGGIADGTSNTILIGERTGFQVTPGYATPWGPVGSILDGTSNTIFFPERGSTAFCLGNTGFEQSGIGELIDGTTNTIVVGENSRVDFCFASARVGSIADGTSNTIAFGESHSSVCFQDIYPAADLVQEVPEPPAAAMLSLALLLLAIGWLTAANRRRLPAGPLPFAQS